MVHSRYFVFGKLFSPEVQDARRFDGTVQGFVVDGGGAQGLFVAGIDLDSGLQVDTFTAMGENQVLNVFFLSLAASLFHRIIVHLLTFKLLAESIWPLEQRTKYHDRAVHQKELRAGS